MTKSDAWNHKWFGIWKETGEAYKKCPSISGFVDIDAASIPDAQAVAEYLDNAQIIATTSRLSFPCAITGKRFAGSIAYRTDGVWLWLDDLAYYVREHNVQLPCSMLKTIQNNNYVPPSVCESDIEKLEWPPVKEWDKSEKNTGTGPCNKAD